MTNWYSLGLAPSSVGSRSHPCSKRRLCHPLSGSLPLQACATDLDTRKSEPVSQPCSGPINLASLQATVVSHRNTLGFGQLKLPTAPCHSTSSSSSSLSSVSAFHVMGGLWCCDHFHLPSTPCQLLPFLTNPDTLLKYFNHVLTNTLFSLSLSVSLCLSVSLSFSIFVTPVKLRPNQDHSRPFQTSEFCCGTIDNPAYCSILHS